VIVIDDGDDEDAELKAALELSLKELQKNACAARRVEADDDDDLRLAIALSLQAKSIPTPATQCDLPALNDLPKTSPFYLNRIEKFEKENSLFPTVSFHELFAGKGIESAILTTMTLDMDWLINSLPRIPLTIVKHYIPTLQHVCFFFFFFIYLNKL
jgi:hypothetical protein